MAQLDGPTRAMLHELRWRKPPRDHRRLWTALTIALLLHALFVAVVWYEMKPAMRAPQVMPVQRDQAIQVRFIARSPAKTQATPPLVPVPPPPPPPRPAREPVSKNAITVHMPESAAPQPAPATSAPRPVLFDRTGQIVLPASASSAPPAADYVQRGPQGDTQIMQQHDVVKYKPTRFDPYWRKSTNAIDDALQKVVEKTTVKKTIELPGGVRIHCGVSLAALAGGCGGDPPPPPPPTDGDERLNMAPAALVKGIPSKKPDVATCIADYRAGKPLPQGCPVDTPVRAVDAEKKKAGQ